MHYILRSTDVHTQFYFILVNVIKYVMVDFER